MTTLPQQTLDAISTPAQVNTPLGTLQFPSACRPTRPSAWPMTTWTTCTWSMRSSGPLVVEALPMTLDLADDLWFRWITDLSLPGPDCGLGGRYLFVGPGYPACPICRVDCGSVNASRELICFKLHLPYTAYGEYTVSCRIGS